MKQRKTFFRKTLDILNIDGSIMNKRTASKSTHDLDSESSDNSLFSDE